MEIIEITDLTAEVKKLTGQVKQQIKRKSVKWNKYNEIIQNVSEIENERR